MSHEPMRFQVICTYPGCYLRDGAYYDEPGLAEFLAWAHEQRRQSDQPGLKHYCVVTDLKVSPSLNPTAGAGGGHG